MTTENSGKIQTLIIAARALAAHQRDEFNSHCAIVAAEQLQLTTSEQVAEAELAFTSAEAALASARLNKLVAQRRLSTVQLQLQQVAGSLAQARQHLWSVCSSDDEEFIVAAAVTYGDRTHSFWLIHQELAAARAALDQAEEGIASGVQHVDSCAAALNKARSANSAAGEALFSAQQSACHPASLGLFGLERAVADAAHALTGTTEEQFAYSYVNTQDLPVWKAMSDAAASS